MEFPSVFWSALCSLSASIAARSLPATSCQLSLLLFVPFLCPAFHFCLSPPPLCLFSRLISLPAFPPSPQTPTLLPLLSSLCLLITFCQEPSEINSIHPALFFQFAPLRFTFFFFHLPSPCSSAVIVKTIKGRHCDHTLLHCFYAADQRSTLVGTFGN